MANELKKFINRIRGRIPGWLNLQNIVFLVVILAFIVIVIWSESLSQFFGDTEASNGITTGTPTILPGTPTPLPEEWLRSASQTNGIIFGAIIIIVAIVAGTAVILIRDRD